MQQQALSTWMYAQDDAVCRGPEEIARREGNNIHSFYMTSCQAVLSCCCSLRPLLLLFCRTRQKHWPQLFGPSTGSSSRGGLETRTRSMAGMRQQSHQAEQVWQPVKLALDQSNKCLSDCAVILASTAKAEFDSLRSLH